MNAGDLGSIKGAGQKNTGACNGLLYGPDTVPGDEDETASGESR